MGSRLVAMLPGDPTAASHARAWLTEHLGDRTPSDTLDDVKLVASELVTNAVQAGGGPVRLTVEHHDGHLHLEVVDDYADAIPLLGQAAPDSSHGRGLTIVAALTLDWGWRASGSGSKVVWADIRVGR